MCLLWSGRRVLRLGQRQQDMGVQGLWAGIDSGFQIQLTIELLCGEERVRGKGAARQAGRRSLAGQPEVVGSRVGTGCCWWAV